MAVHLGVVALVHAVGTWPLGATVALLGGGTALAFLVGVVAVNAGLV